MLYPLHLYRAVRQLYLNKTGRENFFKAANYAGTDAKPSLVVGFKVVIASELHQSLTYMLLLLYLHHPTASDFIP